MNEEKDLHELLVNPFSKSNDIVILHTQLRKNTKISFSELLTEIQQAINLDLKQIKSFIEHLEDNRRFSPLFYFYHFSILEAMHEQNVEKVKQICDKLTKTNPQKFYQDEFIIENNPENPIVEYQKEYYLNKIHVVESFEKLSPEEYAEVKTNVFKALDIIKTVNENLYKEITNILATLNISKGDFHANAVSSLIYFGMMILRYEIQPDTRKLLYFFDYIVHETSHMYLNLLMTFDPFVINSQELYFSPARNTERPMKGIFHAHFVLFRLIIMYRLAEKYFVSTDDNKKMSSHKKQDTSIAKLPFSFSERLQAYESKFRQGDELISKHADLTEVGKKLIQNMNSMVNK